MKNSPFRITINIVSWIVLITFLVAIFFTDLPAWPLFAGALVILVPAQIYLYRTKDER